jgi:hypothetical protein
MSRDYEQLPSPPTGGDLYRLNLRVADEDEASLYVVEHLFVIEPAEETLLRLLDEAKSTFALLYPEAEPVDFGVHVRLVSEHQ